MKLMTKEIEKKMPKLYSTEKETTSPVIVKFFCPWNSWTWYVIEGENHGDDWEFFGLVEGLEPELGYFMLSELQSVSGPAGLKIERDLYFDGYVLDKNSNTIKKGV